MVGYWSSARHRIRRIRSHNNADSGCENEGCFMVNACVSLRTNKKVNFFWSLQERKLVSLQENVHRGNVVVDFFQRYCSDSSYFAF